MKNRLISIIYSLCLLILVTGSSCKKKNENTSEAVQLFIGQSHQGGIVAYILQSGDIGFKSGEVHGIIAAPADLDSVLQWGCEGTLIANASDSTIGAGNKNTIAIVNGCSSMVMAAKLCSDLDIHGYNDWYLPSKQELNELYLNRVKIGGFYINGQYWSSSEYSANWSWMQNFPNNGFQGPTSKSLKGNIRAIRSF